MYMFTHTWKQIETLIFIFLFVCMCVSMWGFVHLSEVALRFQKRMLYSLEQELQTLMSCPM